jgi:hypothetical protein
MKSRISSIHYSSEALKVNLSREFPGFASPIPNGCGRKKLRLFPDTFLPGSIEKEHSFRVGSKHG